MSDLHTFQFTVARALGFPVSTSRLLATDLNTETVTVSSDYALQILHIKSSLHRSTLHNSRREPTWTAEFHCRYYSLSLNWQLLTRSLQFTRSGLLQLRTSHRELTVNELQSLLEILDLTRGKTQSSVLLLTSRVACVWRYCGKRRSREPSLLLRDQAFTVA
jgi:hypothetical protein